MNLDLHRHKKPTIIPVVWNRWNGDLRSLQMTRFFVVVEIFVGNNDRCSLQQFVSPNMLLFAFNQYTQA